MEYEYHHQLKETVSSRTEQTLNTGMESVS